MTSFTSVMALLIAPVANVICSCICCIAVELALADVLEISDTAFFTSSIVTCRVADMLPILVGKSAIACAAVPNCNAKFSNSFVAESDIFDLNSLIMDVILYFNSSTTFCIISVAGEAT